MKKTAMILTVSFSLFASVEAARAAEQFFACPTADELRHALEAALPNLKTNMAAQVKNRSLGLKENTKQNIVGAVNGGNLSLNITINQTRTGGGLCEYRVPGSNTPIFTFKY